MAERKPFTSARVSTQRALIPASELPPGEALHTLCFGRAEATPAEATMAAELVEQLHLEEDSLWLARDVDGSAAAAGLVYNPGGAVIFTSPVETHTNERLVAAAVDAACRHADPLRASLVEGIVRRHEQRVQRALVLAGFKNNCEIMDMRARIPSELPCVTPLAEFGITAWTHEVLGDAVFARCLEATFQNSDDYDEASSRRTAQEHLNLIRWRRQFDPSLWLALLAGDHPAGMVALHVEGDSLELAYIGLAPEWRNRGLGAVILDHIFTIAAELGLGDVSCVVKQCNPHALRFYQRRGFEIISQRLLVSRFDIGTA